MFSFSLFVVVVAVVGIIEIKQVIFLFYFENNQMNEQSVDLQKLSTLSPTDSSDAGLNTTAKLKMSDNTTTNNNNIQITANDTDDMEDDVTSPFKANHADLITLSSNENEIKTGKSSNTSTTGLYRNITLFSFNHKLLFYFQYGLCGPK